MIPYHSGVTCFLVGAARPAMLGQKLNLRIILSQRLVTLLMFNQLVVTTIRLPVRKRQAGTGPKIVQVSGLLTTILLTWGGRPKSKRCIISTLILCVTIAVEEAIQMVNQMVALLQAGT